MSGSNSDVDERVLRVSGLVLTNAFLFHEIVARSEGEIDTLRQVMLSGDPIGNFIKQWDHIVGEIDYAPIFELASEVLIRLPSSPETEQAIEELVDGAIDISGSRAALRHDLMGRMFHRLIGNPKFYGARYTKIPAANTLMKLTTDEMEYDWEDPAEVQNLTVTDLACGTGTLLKSTLGAVLDQYIETAVEQGETASTVDVHAEFVEEGIWGFDVLPSAVHLAATGLALHDPEVRVDNMRIYALPLGGPSNRLGSIDFARDQRFLVQQTLMGETAFSAKQAIEENNTTNGDNSVALPDFDVVTMNPPFTRNVYDSFLYGDLDEDERQDLMGELRDVRDEQGLEANIRPGIGTVFVALADRVVNDDGILSFVLPKTLLSGSDWDQTRDILDDYNLRYVLSSHEAGNWNFSEDTGLSETLVVADAASDEEGTYYINLWEQPKAYAESLSLSNLISNADDADIDSQGVAELQTDGKKYGEIIKAPTQEEELPWVLPAAFAQTELVRSGYHLLDGAIYVPGHGEVGEIELVELDSRATLGPDGRDVYDGFNTTDSPTAYEALWGMDSEEANSLIQESNQYLSPLSQAKSGRPLRDADTLWGRAGSLMLPKELRLNTNSTAGVTLSDKALSNVWWPTRWDGNDEDENRRMERRLALWLNSTLGIFSMLCRRQDTEGPFVKFPKAWWKSVDVIDLESLDDDQLEKLDELWDEVNDEKLQSFPEMSTDETRETIDAVFEDILNIDGLDTLRDFLSREPVMSGEPIV
jgi:hypothetical protein